MRTEEEIRKEIHYIIKQGFLDAGYSEPMSVMFDNGYVKALKWVLGEEE